MASWQDDPVVAPATKGASWQGDPIVGGGSAAPAKAASGPPQSMLHDIGNTIDSAVTLGGADWLTSKLPGAPSLSDLQATTEASRSRVPWYVRAPIDVAGYAMGPGKVLGPAGAAMTGGPIAAGVAEGAMAGGLSSGFGSNFDPTSTGLGAAGGAALGGVAGGVGAGIAKLTAKPGTIDPQAAIDATKSARDALYGKLQSTPVGSNSLKNAYASATLTPGMAADVSPGFNALIGRQLAQVDAGGITANDVADFAKNLKAGATSNGDTILAGKISDNLLGALPADAQQTLQQANAAHQQYMMAQNLAEWQRKAAAGAPLGQAPLTEAENWYQGKPQYQTLADLYTKSQSQQDPSWALGHMAGHALGTAGYALGGFPGSMVGEMLGILGVKPAIKGMFKGAKQNALQKSIQQAYPQMTGQPLTGAQPGLQVGDAVKNLMLGSVY